MYQWRAALHGDAGNVCLGVDCFRLAFVAGAALELGAMLLALALYFRTRALYYSTSGERERAGVQAQVEHAIGACEDAAGCERMDREPLLRGQGV